MINESLNLDTSARDADIDNLLASIAKAGEKTKRAEHQDTVAQVQAQAKTQTLSMPPIPTRDEANADGCVIPEFIPALLLRHGVMMPPTDGVEFPLIPNPSHLEAYNLISAFIRDYGEHYVSGGFNVRPSFILKMWIQALDPTDKDRRRNLALSPWELRLVVEAMASTDNGHTPQMFNPRNMIAVATKIRVESVDEKTFVTAKAKDEYLHRFPVHSYLPYQRVDTPHVNEAILTKAPLYWTNLAGYPQAFGNVPLRSELLNLVNSLVRIRIQDGSLFTNTHASEDENLTQATAQLLATNMLRVSATQAQAGRSLHPQDLVDLAYRYSASYLQKAVEESKNP